MTILNKAKVYGKRVVIGLVWTLPVALTFTYVFLLEVAAGLEDDSDIGGDILEVLKNG